VTNNKLEATAYCMLIILVQNTSTDENKHTVLWCLVRHAADYLCTRTWDLTEVKLQI